MDDVIALDIETTDPHLKDLGCGAVRNDGRILTVAAYSPELGIEGYWTWDQFLDDDEILDILEDPEVKKVFHNGLYDLNWLCLWGHLKITNIDDTLTREVLLDANQYTYNLDACCARHEIGGKNKTDTIERYWGSIGGKGKAIEHLTEIPVDIVGKYNVQDCIATYNLWKVQQPLLEQQDLLRCLSVENRLYEWLLKTKKTGLRINESALSELTQKVQHEYVRKLFEWETTYGDVNCMSSVALAKLFTKLGIPIPQKRGGGGNTFDADALTDIEHPIGRQIIELRALKKLLGTYLEGQFVTFNYKGHIHGDLHPAKSDDGGTVTGRFSCLGIGTRVFTTERGYIPIEEIRSGMHIVTHKGTVRPVKRLMFTGVAQVGYLGKLLCTAHHPILSEDGRYWVGAECCNSYMEVDDDSLYQRFGQTHEKTGTGTLWYMLAEPSPFPFRCVGSGEGPAILPLETWGEKSDDRKDRGTQSHLYWGCGRWPRVQDPQGEWKVLLYTQSSDGRGTWHQCVGTPRVGGSPSYRWEPAQQFPGQLGTRNEQGTWEAARTVPEHRGWRAVGILPTFDIEVLGEEHSFIAEGVIVHNCSHPNTQNISAREEKFGNEVRSLFIPEDGCILGAFDYKQIEYRVFVHFAIALKAKGWEHILKEYQDNPDTDYHAFVQKLMGWYFEDDKHKTKVFRHIVKNLNFGSLYGLGPTSFAHKFRHPLRMAHPDYAGPLKGLAEYLMTLYKQKIPIVKPTCDAITRTGEARGYVRTVSGRRQRIRDNRGAYTLINYLCQGSAGDIIKKAIADSWDAGVWDVLIPHTMVHDELVFSIPDTREGYEACLKLKECMINAYHLEIPLGVDTEIGPDWGHCNEENWNEFEKKWTNR